jgi:hypothetical protein
VAQERLHFLYAGMLRFFVHPASLPPLLSEREGRGGGLFFLLPYASIHSMSLRGYDLAASHAIFAERVAKALLHEAEALLVGCE